MLTFHSYIANYIESSIQYLKDGENLKNLHVARKMPLILMMAFYYEALANHYGECLQKVLDDDFEKKSPKEKFKYLGKQGGFTVNFGKAPYKSCKQILDLRNILAHPKTEKASFDSFAKKPIADWISQVEKLDISAALLDLEQIKLDLPNRLGVEKLNSMVLGEVI